MSIPDRPSRQALVVPPRSSNVPLVAGIIASGTVGCGLVWGLIGRESRREPARPDAPAVADLLPHELASPLPTIESRPVRPTSFQDRNPATVEDADLEPAGVDSAAPPFPADRGLSRFSRPIVPTVSEEGAAPADGGPPADGAVTLSRFTIDELPAADLDSGPADADPMADRPPAAEAAVQGSRFPPAKEGVRFLAPVDDDDPDDLVIPNAGSPPERFARAVAAPRGLDAVALQTVELEDDLPVRSDDDAPPGRAIAEGDAPDERGPDSLAPRGLAPPGTAFDEDPGSAARDHDDEQGQVAEAEGDPAVPAPGPTAAAASPEPPESAAPMPPPRSPFAQAPPLVEPTAGPEPGTLVGPPPGSPAAVAALPPQPAGPTGGLLPRFPAGDVPVQTPSAPPSMAVPVSNPFISAPPLAGAASRADGFRSNGYDDERPLPTPPPDGFATASGQGRPGPAQLEGVQAPQLTVEKRGPREVQVGKPARYEVFVRNVGTAVAHDVVLRDAVPVGTTLVTTTPPAMPGRAATGVPTDELVWPLGTLPPGGQSRVVIELMPQTEGEIGSVASVMFRADASVRSRATRPALAIDCPTPEPVRIGGDALLRITVENPGTGVATGVVLEGFLPDTVSHRSGRELEFDVGQLKPGETRSIELVLGTRGPGIHPARLVARADGGLEVERLVRLEVTAPTLEVAVDMPVRRFLQRAATCEISMVNAGTATARSVELAAQLPPGLKFVRANNAGWHDDRTNRVLWNLEELPAGETGTVEVVVMPVELGPQKIVAAARSIDGLADQVAHVCEVEGLAALFFEVTDSEDPIEVNGVTEYVIRVGNQGTQAATGVRLVATLLGDLQPIAAQGPAGHRVENLTVAFEPLAKLAPSEEVVFRVRARGLSAGDQRVQVQLTSADHPAPITKEEVTRVYSDR